MKEKLFSILSADEDRSLASRLYNYLNIGMTLISVIPLMFNRQTENLWDIETAALIFFVIDYVLQWVTADQKFPNKSKTRAYLTYPFTFFAVVDLLAILPFLGLINQSWRLFRLFRLFRSLRIFRAFRLFRNSRSFGILGRTIKKQKDPLTIVGIVVISYIFIAALLVYNIEPDTFPTFMEALVWATESLTTATYSDYYPTSIVGQILSMISYLVGVGIIALPSSILTAGYIDELKEEHVLEPKHEEQKEET